MVIAVLPFFGPVSWLAADGQSGQGRKPLSNTHLPSAGFAVRDEQTISMSWDRCRNEFGLDQWTGRHETAIRRERVRDSIETLGPLFSACRSQVQHIFQNIVGSGHAVILTDQSGTIVEFAVQSSLEDLFRQAGLRRGADWSEACEGTNGIGTAIREKKSLTVYRDQHFLSNHASLTCTGAPVFDVTGDVLALFDVSSIGRSDDPEILAHTRALLEMSARLISRRNFQDHFSDHWILRFHRDEERVGLLEEGLLALDQDGRIIGADEQAISHLELGGRHAIVGTAIGQLFEVGSGELEHKLSGTERRPTELRLHDGFVSKHRTLHTQLVGPKSEQGGVGRFVSSPPVGASRARLKSLRSAATAANTREPVDPLMQLIGPDPHLRQLATKAAKLMAHDVPLLITGETGVGKDSFSRALHEGSDRKDAPFIAVNCAALPENLIEGELFGYKAGAFTGAQASGFKGQLLAANGGTLLLDEIGDMPLSAQTRLLQVLERRKVTPLGSTQGVDLDVRLIAATHQSLKTLCAQGRFRDDLYYRICGFTVALPPLRERSDMGYLVSRLLPGRLLERSEHFSSAARAMISRYPWPGNIRQLKHVLKTADILAEGGVITPEHLDPIADGSAASFGSSGVGGPVREDGEIRVDACPVPSSLLDFSDQEKAVLEAALRTAQWNVSQCATTLGVSRNTLYRKMKQHKIRRMN